MENFEFQNTTRIIFGRDQSARIALEAKKWAGRILLVTGKGSVRRSGLLKKTITLLQNEGLDVWNLSGVQSNPLLSKVKEGIELVRENGIQAVVAVGGGSVMDTSKAVAAGAVLTNGDVWDFFEGRQEIKDALPVLTVPTIAASGSEMNGFMVITNEKTGHKLATGSRSTYPKVSILDPCLTFSVPADYTAYGGVDAVCHLLEPYFNAPAPHTPVQDRLAEGLIETIMKSTESCLAVPDDYEARADLMWGASLALCGLTKAGVGEHHFPVHLIEHSISAIHGIPHGAGLAALLPGWMRWRVKTGHPEKIAQMGRRIFKLESSGLPDAGSSRRQELLAMESIATFENWLSRIGCPSRLMDIGIKADSHEAIAQNALQQATIWGMERQYDKKTITRILAYC